MHHVVEKALALREKYGRFIDYATLLEILEDRECVRFPTRLEFNSQPIDDGFFAVARPVSAGHPSKGYIIYIHEHFKDRLGDVPALALYHLVAVNYGDIATREDAELFGAAALGMDKDEYYRLLCRLADQIPP